MFKLFYWVENGGDGSGSVSVHFEESAKAADKAESDSNDEYGDGWAESSVGSVTLDIQNNLVVIQETVWDGKKHNTVWKPLEIEKIKKAKK